MPGPPGPGCGSAVALASDLNRAGATLMQVPTSQTASTHMELLLFPSPPPREEIWGCAIFSEPNSSPSAIWTTKHG